MSRIRIYRKEEAMTTTEKIITEATQKYCNWSK